MESRLNYKVLLPEWCRSIFSLICVIAQKTALIFSDQPEHGSVKEMEQAVRNQQAENILNTYGNSILRYAYTYLHNISDSEDIVQDTLIQFLKAAPVFASRQQEKAWLLRVAANLSKNRLRYNAVRTADELSDTLSCEAQEDLSFVWEAVRALPVKYREVVHLFYHEDLSTKQIAAVLQKNESTIRSDLHRGRAKLKEILREVYDFEETV